MGDMNDNSVSISLLVHSRHQKINVIHSIQESNLHINYCTAQKPRGKKPLWGGVGGVLWGGGGGRLLTAINLILKTCNLQSNDAILIINVLVLDSVIGIKAKQRKQSGWLLG